MKTILLTGATDGIGLETAKEFAKEGHKLLIHGRNKAKLENVKNILLGIKEDLFVDMYVADFSVLNDVKNMAKEILAKYSKIDVLINNAGIFVTENIITKENLDVRFAVNTIAPFILTKKLLPIISEDGRIVNLSSAAQAPVSLEALKGKKQLSHSEAYAQSKLALTMWSMFLSEEVKDKKVIVSVNPKSFLGSKMVKQAYGREGYDLKLGSDILYRASLSNEFKDANGKYYDNDYEVFANPHPFGLEKTNRSEVIKILNEFL